MTSKADIQSAREKMPVFDMFPPQLRQELANCHLPWNPVQIWEMLRGRYSVSDVIALIRAKEGRS